MCCDGCTLCVVMVKKYFVYYTEPRGRDRSVGIATEYGLEIPGIESRIWTRYIANVQTGPVANPASCSMGTGTLPGVKRPERGADQPTPSRAEVTNQ
jgi:hypothetical protein